MIASNVNAELEILATYIEEANTSKFMPDSLTYESSSDDIYPTENISYSQIHEPVRNSGVEWFDRERSIRIIEGMIGRVILPPVEVHVKPNDTIYSVKNGFHRYYISRVLGFQKLPISVKPYFDFNAL